jgi:hypothetical protein
VVATFLVSPSLFGREQNRDWPGGLVIRRSRPYSERFASAFR